MLYAWEGGWDIRFFKAWKRRGSSCCVLGKEAGMAKRLKQRVLDHRKRPQNGNQYYNGAWNIGYLGKGLTYGAPKPRDFVDVASSGGACATIQKEQCASIQCLWPQAGPLSSKSRPFTHAFASIGMTAILFKLWSKMVQLRGPATFSFIRASFVMSQIKTHSQAGNCSALELLAMAGRQKEKCFG